MPYKNIDEHRDQVRSASRKWYYKKKAESPGHHSKRMKEYRKTNKHRFRAYQMKSKFGITTKQYDELMESQAGLCAICTESLPPGRSAHIDHNHSTGEIRALLCRKCNVGLGSFRDDALIARAAADYLEAHS